MNKGRPTTKAIKPLFSCLSIAAVCLAPVMGVLAGSFLYDYVANSYDQSVSGDVKLAYSFDACKVFLIGPCCMAILGLLCGIVGIFRHESRPLSIIAIVLNAIVACITGVSIIYYL